MGVVDEILTGLDPNGSKEDVQLTFHSGYLDGTGSSKFWLDPDPDKRTVPLPDRAADALSVCMHELGHALGFAGWRDMTTERSRAAQRATSTCCRPRMDRLLLRRSHCGFRLRRAGA